jgi:hypothetical protein
MTSRYAELSRDQLAVVVPELLLIGHLIDRSGMAWCITAFGREEMTQIAIEEWACSSPVYTRRMQRALGFLGDDVPTIFKGLQLDIGAPPQFMDFRYTVHDRWHGEFQLDHCGALLDVEPMGPEYVQAMCHDIEDPTFDATAVATNPKAQVRPIHRPPRAPADRHPHCAWTVVIDESYPDAVALPGMAAIEASQAARLELDPIDVSQEGGHDYAGPLLSDLDFSSFSHSALVRIADEVCVQMHLLVLSFQLAVRKRAADVAQADEIVTKQLVGIAGIAAERLRSALDLGDDLDAACTVLRMHPLLNPAAYVQARVQDGVVAVEGSPAHEDEAWIARCGPFSTRPLQAIVQAVNPCLDVRVTGTDHRWEAELVVLEAPAKELDEVAVTRFSKGAGFTFQPRRSLPLMVV